LEAFPFESPIQVRFRDLDSMGHVNNAVFATYFEEGRSAFFREVFGVSDPKGFDFILARIEIDYRRPVRLADDLRVGLRVASLGTTSFVLEYRLRAGEEVAAEGRSVQVSFDYGRRAKKPLSADFLEKVRPFTAGGGERC
jgi:acyl-CoA thioester hydrolase